MHKNLSPIYCIFEVIVHARIKEFLSGGSRSDRPENSMDISFFLLLFFLVLNLFYSLQRGPIILFYYRENYTFLRIQRGFNIFHEGGSNFFQGGGSKC